MNDVEPHLDALDRDGFVLISQALASEEASAYGQKLKDLFLAGHEHGANDVGTLWFDDVLDVDRELFGALIAHPSVREEMRALCGPQLQLRSVRGHYYPGEYRQHWHMDFYGYWEQEAQGRIAARGVGINTTFYFQDAGPDTSYLQFVAGGHRQRPGGLDRSRVLGTAENEFTQWCDRQEHVEIYPKAGDCVMFYSHIPHRGIKVDATSERSNVVCHYQTNPFHQGVWFLSEALGDNGTYPLAQR